MTKFAESTIEEAAVEWLQELGYEYAFGPEITFRGQAQGTFKLLFNELLFNGEQPAKINLEAKK